MSLKKLIDLPDLGDQRGGLVAIEANQSASIGALLRASIEDGVR